MKVRSTPGSGACVHCAVCTVHHGAPRCGRECHDLRVISGMGMGAPVCPWYPTAVSEVVEVDKVDKKKPSLKPGNGVGVHERMHGPLRSVSAGRAQTRVFCGTECTVLSIRRVREMDAG